MDTNIIHVDVPRVRLKVRRVNELTVARRALMRARAWGHAAWAVDDGGGVCNSYGYRAETEGCVAYALPTGEVVVWVARLPANKVTPAGVCRAVGADLLIPLNDDRFSADTWEIARPHAIRCAEQTVRAYMRRAVA